MTQHYSYFLNTVGKICYRQQKVIARISAILCRSDSGLFRMKASKVVYQNAEFTDPEHVQNFSMSMVVGLKSNGKND